MTITFRELKCVKSRIKGIMTSNENQKMLVMSKCPLWKILGGYFLEMEMWKLEIKLLDPNRQASPVRI